ncbi:hypothetical protein FRC04_007980 [Tulasnella sp. 424]|nr:hypothetical protein FRC04_007980 [Tulasnella sp. 424]KAG8974839.1 hypothetical protein FRC05_006772 [Tulasnella sp. 425]
MASSGSSGQNTTSQAAPDAMDTTTITNQPSSSNIKDTPLPLAELLEALNQTYDLSEIDIDQRFRLAQLYMTADSMQEVESGRLHESQLSESQRERLSSVRMIKEQLDELPIGNENPYDNLRGYTQTARLPPMPWRWGLDYQQKKQLGGTKKSRRTAQTDVSMRTAQTQQTVPNPPTPTKGKSTRRSPEKPRELGYIQKIPMDEFCRLVKQFSIDHIPEVGIDSNGKRVRTDDPGRRDVLKVVSHQYRAHDPFLSVPNSEEGVRIWISQLALPTATRILHVSDPNTAAWTFSIVGGKGTGQLLSDYAWEKKPSPNSDDVTLRRLIVEAKAPWVMPLSELRRFADMEKLPTLAELQSSGRSGKPNEKFTNEENAWAQIYDYCYGQGHHYFILTTYEHWVFGVFSLNYTSARVSDIIPYSSLEPSVLECITYWVQSSMFVPGSFEIPLFGPNDTGPPAAPLEPPVWEKSRSLWRYHGFQELERAAALASFSLTPSGTQTNQTQGQGRNSSLSISGALPPQEEDNFRRFLIESGKILDRDCLPPVAALGKAALTFILGMQWIPHFSWVLRLTWLALVQNPTYLDRNALQLEAAFVDAASGLPVHPINAASTTEHLARKTHIEAKKANLSLPNLLPDYSHFTASGGPLRLRTDDLKAFYKSLLTEETAWVLLRFLHPDSVAHVERALTVAGYISLDLPPFLPVSVTNETATEDQAAAASASTSSRESTPGFPVTPESLVNEPLPGDEPLKPWSSHTIVDTRVTDQATNTPAEIGTEPSSFVLDAPVAHGSRPFHHYSPMKPIGRSPAEFWPLGKSVNAYGRNPESSRSIPASMDLDRREETCRSNIGRNDRNAKRDLPQTGYGTSRTTGSFVSMGAVSRAAPPSSSKSRAHDTKPSRNTGNSDSPYQITVPRPALGKRKEQPSRANSTTSMTDEIAKGSVGKELSKLVNRSAQKKSRPSDPPGNQSSSR